MSKFKAAILLALLLGIVVSVAAFAGGFAVVTYDDTSARIRPATNKITTEQYIANGDFLDWKDGYPVGWNVPTPVLSPGWTVHFAQMDYARNGGADGGKRFMIKMADNHRNDLGLG